MLNKVFLVLILMILFINDATALSFGKQTKLVKLRIIPEYTVVTPTTKSISLITEATIKKDWHLYWDNPGDIGSPTTLEFYDTPYYTINQSIHSAPHKSVFEDIITSYIYSEKVYFKTTFALKDINKIKHLPFNIVFSYTACHKSCQPEQITTNFALAIAKFPHKNTDYLDALTNAETTFPINTPVIATLNNHLLNLEFAKDILKDCKNPEYVNRHPKKSALSDLPKTQYIDEQNLNIDFQNKDFPPDFDGILLCPKHKYNLEIQNKLLPPPSPISISQTNSPSHTEHPSNLWYYILIAFVAGLILNLMPCVLPILTLKALHLIQTTKRISAISAISYLLGVICSFMTLASILYYLRSNNNELGWGFQLQSPTFNIILLLLFFTIFLSLIDKLPIPNSFADKLNNIAGNKSFLTGFFAVIISCPCTGPFMGAALGYAITQPTITYFSIFLSLSIGYGLPYTLIELFPNLFLKYIPKPGNWMITFKRILALPIILTCLWLSWVIFNQLRPSATSAEISWEPYNPTKVEEAISSNTPVFINFTAKWCLICLLNDKSTLSTKNFHDLAKQHNVRLFKADWTNRDKTIRKALDSYNRNSIPLYVWYPSQSTTPTILPQILTGEIIKQYFTK